MGSVLEEIRVAGGEMFVLKEGWERGRICDYVFSEVSEHWIDHALLCLEFQGKQNLEEWGM